MAAKSVVDIELRDEAFNKFKALFDEYNDKLKAMPSNWSKVDSVIKSNASTLTKLRAIVKDTADKIKATEKNQEKLTHAAQGTIKAFTVLSKRTKEIAKNLFHATGSLMKWARLSGIATGLLGAGSLFGISRLAESAGQMQITARGAGVTQGQLKAAQINLGQMLGGEGGVTQVLDKITEMKHDVTMRAPLAAMGITQFKGKSSADILFELLEQIRSKSKEMGPGALPFFKATGIEKVIDPNTLIALGEYQKKELQNLKARFTQDSKTLAISQGTTGALANLSRTLGTSGQSIENVFMASLAKLAPQIERLSRAFAGAVRSLMRSSLMKEGIDKLSEGLGRLAKYLTSAEFKEDITEFINAMKVMKDAFMDMAEFIGKLTGHPLKTKASDMTAGFGIGGDITTSKTPHRPVSQSTIANIVLQTWTTPGADYNLIANALRPY